MSSSSLQLFNRPIDQWDKWLAATASSAEAGSEGGAAGTVTNFIAWVRAAVDDGGAGVSAAEWSDASLKNLFRLLDKNGDGVLNGGAGSASTAFELGEMLGHILADLARRVPATAGTQNLTAAVWNQLPDWMKQDGFFSDSVSGATIAMWFSLADELRTSSDNPYFSLSRDDISAVLAKLKEMDLPAFDPDAANYKGIGISPNDALSFLFESLDKSLDGRIQPDELLRCFNEMKANADALGFEISDSTQQAVTSASMAQWVGVGLGKGIIEPLVRQIIQQTQEDSQRLAAAMRN